MKDALTLVGLLLVTASTIPCSFAGLVPINEVFEPAPPADLSRYAKVAVVQWAPDQSTPLGVTVEQAEAFKDQNRKTLEAYIREAAAKGAKWVITPEFAIVGYPDIPELPPEEDEYRNREDIRPYVERVPGSSTNYFSKLARELKIYIHIGFAEEDSLTRAYHNTVVAIDPQGNLVAKYRKMNLYQGEKKFLFPGLKPSTYNSPIGKVGLIICADVYSQIMRVYKALRVDVFALSTSWAQWNSGMDYFTRAARQNNAFLLAANQSYFPDSGVINPDGSLQSHIRQTTGIAYGYVPLK